MKEPWRAVADKGREPGPATKGATPSKEAQQGPAPTLHTDVSTLSKETRELVEQMLIEGATCEDTMDAVNERDRESVTLQAVQNFLRSNLGLQKRRIQRQLETAKELTGALGKSRSSLRDLADAIFLTGMMGVNRQVVNFGRVHAMRERLERENLQLKKQFFRLKARKTVQEREFAQARILAERARGKLLQAQVNKLKQLLKGAKENRKLDSDTWHQIQEIYGLAKKPVRIERETENSDAENSPAQA